MSHPDIAWVDVGTVCRQATGAGVAWSLAESDDLNVNAVHLDAGTGIANHVNREVDVLILVVGGSGRLTSGDESVPLKPGTLAHVRRGVERGIRADPAGLDYLTIHRRRAGLTIGSPG